MEQLMEVNVPYIYVIANNVKWQIISINREVGAFEDGNDHRPWQLTPKQYLNAGNWLARRRG